MFWRRIFAGKAKVYKTHLLTQVFTFKDISVRKYNGFSAHYRDLFTGSVRKKQNHLSAHQNSSSCFTLQIKYYSRGLLDGEESELQEKQQEKELLKINQLFPMPRVTLNELTTKTPEKIYNIQYKQNLIAPKASRKKQKPQSNDWTCTYSFVWPEKIKFEATAISKRQAAEKAAIQALHYLYINKRIDNKGNPVYDKDKIKELRENLQEPIKINVSEKCMERIDKVWEDYQNEIKDIYEKTFKEAANKNLFPQTVLQKDSTIDEDDGFSEIETKIPDNEVEDNFDQKIRVHPVFGKTVHPPSESTLQRRERLLKQKFDRYDEEMTPPLPIDQYRDQITSTLASSRVVVIVGAAGCGKSTRAPAAILRHGLSAANVLVSEPRRVAAIGLAERVAIELGEQVGETVGYQVRLGAKPPRPPAGGLLYCTSGVLLRRLQTNPGLQGCSHVFIDEAHERDVNTDVTLLLLKRALDINPELKIVVMSATLDIDVFTKYFDSCPVIEVPGRAYPVEVKYLDEIQKQFNIALPNTMENCQKEDGRPYVNCQEVVEVIKAVDRTQPEGAILVFLPGWAEIKFSKTMLEKQFPETTHMILPVHSRLSTSDQVKMFSRPLPGVRKIVLATNIAETSVTIPDVVHVIDSGAHKENTVREGTGTASLETVWVSRAGAKQRAGRAGRVQPGHCYKLYTKEKESELIPHSTPEILRVPLEQTVLDCKSYAPADKVEDFLSQLPEPPTHKAIQFAVNDLTDLGALTPSEQLTRLGYILSTLSLAPRLGKALLHAAVAGNVLTMANVTTHCQDNQQLFDGQADRKEEVRETKRRYSETSDHSALHWIQDEFEQHVEELGWRGADEWCKRNGLRKDRLGFVKSLSNLYIEQLLKTGILETSIEPEDLNKFCAVDEITAAILLSGTDAILKTKRNVKTKGKLKTANELFTSTGDRAHIGSESVNYNITKKRANSLLVYSHARHSAERRALVAYMTTVIPPHTALIAARHIQKHDGNDDTAILSLPRHRLEVHMSSSQADKILKAREMLLNTFQYYVERDLKTSDYDEVAAISRFKVRLMKAIGRILVEGHREYVQGKKIDDFVDG